MKTSLKAATARTIQLTLIAALAALPAMVTASFCNSVSGNLVTNCGFEAGVFSSTLGESTNTNVPDSWTPNVGFDEFPGFNEATNVPANVNTGAWALRIGNFDSGPTPTLSQTFADTLGTTYNGSLYVSYGGAGEATRERRFRA